MRPTFGNAEKISMLSAVEIKVKVIRDAPERSLEVPALLTSEGVLEVLVDYFVSSSKSISWMMKRRWAVKKFLQFMSVSPAHIDPKALFSNFARTLETGTFEIGSGLDKSGLCWFPMRNVDAQGIINGLTDLFDWMHARGYVEVHPNPFVEASASGKALVEAAYQHRRNAAFLGHSWAINFSSSTQGKMLNRRTVTIASPAGSSEVPAFPEDRFNELLFSGFKVDGQLNYRNMLITILMHGAGFRVSEPFHLFISDVERDPENSRSARVLIHHPEQGSVPILSGLSGFSKASNRSAYLMEQWALPARNRILGTKHAGWKGGKHTQSGGARFFPAYWFPPHLGEMYLELWAAYLIQVARHKRDHPFAFINLTGNLAGEMLSMKAFRKAHGDACERIGLTVSKELGTTPHGHRHAYARRLVACGVQDVIRQRCLHHSNIKSQEVYTTPLTSQVVLELRAASTRLSSSLDSTASL